MRKEKDRGTKSIRDRWKERKFKNMLFYQDALFMHAIKQMDLWRMTVLQTKNIENA